MELCECGHHKIIHFKKKSEPACFAPGCECKEFKEKEKKDDVCFLKIKTLDT